MDRAPIISSGNPGFIARVSCAFEQEGLRHQLDVQEGTMVITVPTRFIERAFQLIIEHNLQEWDELPGKEFAHLQAMDLEELEAVVKHPEEWTAAEVCAAKQLLGIKERECEQVQEYFACCQSPSRIPNTYRTLGRRKQFGMAMLSFLAPPLALFLCCFVFLHRSSTYRGNQLHTFCPTSRSFAVSILPFTIITNFLLFSWFVSL